MEEVDRLHREDRINTATEHMATRINRLVADQLQAHLEQASRTGKRILIASAPDEPEDLGAQMCADLFEADGWDVYLVGGGVPEDEILSLVGQLRPDILLLFGTQPQGVPSVRHMIDRIREIGAHPTMNIMISGGVFNRAHGLWQEINADLFAPTAMEALEVANAAKPREATIRQPAGVRKRRRRRRSPYLEPAEAEA
jgi:methanogenic corrinoid protein MtbC1